MPPHLTADGERALMDLSGLAGELEREPEIRGYLRKDSKEEVVLFDDHIQDCVKHACFPHIHCILQIFLKKTIAVETMPQPPIHPLRDELRTLYNLCGREPDDKTIIQDSWMIRKFLGLVKMKTRKAKVSTDPRLYNSYVLIFRLTFHKRLDINLHISSIENLALGTGLGQEIPGTLFDPKPWTSGRKWITGGL